MKVSIITSVFNNKDTIEDAIKSVINQDYYNIEYIIIDGNSTDGTKNIIKKYDNKISKFISEPDKGIYDGLNKGVSLASGDIVGFLHSDDLYYDENTIQKITKYFEYNIDGVYGDLLYISKKDESKVLRYWKSCDFDKKLLKRGWMPAHPTLFLRKKVYEKYGNFDLNYKISGDYDFILRILKNNIDVRYIPEVLYKMRVGGESNKSLKNIITKTKEDFQAIKKNKVGGWITLFIKNISKVRQFFRS